MMLLWTPGVFALWVFNGSNDYPINLPKFVLNILQALSGPRSEPNSATRMINSKNQCVQRCHSESRRPAKTLVAAPIRSHGHRSQSTDRHAKITQEATGPCRDMAQGPGCRVVSRNARNTHVGVIHSDEMKNWSKTSNKETRRTQQIQRGYRLPF